MFSFILQFRGEWYIFRQEKWQPLNFLHCCGSYLQTRRKKLRRLWCYRSPVTGALKSQLFMIFMRYLLCTSEKSASLRENGLRQKSSSGRRLHVRTSLMDPIRDCRRHGVAKDLAWSEMTAAWTWLVSGRLGQRRRGLTLLCVFALNPCQGKENT